MKKAKRPLALFFADSHLDLGAWANRPRIRGDAMFAFEYIINKAIELKVQAVFGAGDLIDVKKPPAEVVEFVRKQMDRLEELQIQFCFIQGQHELSQRPWFSAIHAWPLHLSGHVYRLGVRGQVTVCGLDWQPADKLQAALEKVHGDTDILMCHQVWEEFMGSERACEGSLTQIPIATTAFTGDYHKTLTPEFLGADGQKLKVISPGATHMRAIDEPPEHFYYVMYDDGTFQEQPIPSRVAMYLEVRNEDDLDKIEDSWLKHLEVNLKDRNRGLPKPLHLPLVRIVIRGDVEDAHKRITKLIGKAAEIFWKVIPEETEELEISRKQYDKVVAQGLTGCLELVVPKADPQYAPLLRLLSTDGQELELQKMRQERGLTCD